jgi:hypothetical protein
MSSFQSVLRAAGSDHGLTTAARRGAGLLAAFAVVGVVLLFAGPGPRVALGRGSLGPAFPLGFGGGPVALVVAAGLLLTGALGAARAGDLPGGAGALDRGLEVLAGTEPRPGLTAALGLGPVGALRSPLWSPITRAPGTCRRVSGSTPSRRAWPQ